MALAMPDFRTFFTVRLFHGTAFHGTVSRYGAPRQMTIAETVCGLPARRNDPSGICSNERTL